MQGDAILRMYFIIRECNAMEYGKNAIKMDYPARKHVSSVIKFGTPYGHMVKLFTNCVCFVLTYLQLPSGTCILCY